jgi:hypothetical protein
MKYEFRSADGTPCCKSDDIAHLCADCRAAAARAAAPDPYAAARQLDAYREDLTRQFAQLRDDTRQLEARLGELRAANRRSLEAPPALCEAPDPYRVGLNRLRAAAKRVQ